jgi:hypothetical protein
MEVGSHSEFDTAKGVGLAGRLRLIEEQAKIASTSRQLEQTYLKSWRTEHCSCVQVSGLTSFSIANE